MIFHPLFSYYPLGSYFEVNHENNALLPIPDPNEWLNIRSLEDDFASTLFSEHSITSYQAHLFTSLQLMLDQPPLSLDPLPYIIRFHKVHVHLGGSIRIQGENLHLVNDITLPSLNIGTISKDRFESSPTGIYFEFEASELPDDQIESCTIYSHSIVQHQPQTSRIVSVEYSHTFEEYEHRLLSETVKVCCIFAITVDPNHQEKLLFKVIDDCLNELVSCIPLEYMIFSIVMESPGSETFLERLRETEPPSAPLLSNFALEVIKQGMETTTKAMRSNEISEERAIGRLEVLQELMDWMYLGTRSYFLTLSLNLSSIAVETAYMGYLAYAGSTISTIILASSATIFTGVVAGLAVVGGVFVLGSRLMRNDFDSLLVETQEKFNVLKGCTDSQREGGICSLSGLTLGSQFWENDHSAIGPFFSYSNFATDTASKIQDLNRQMSETTDHRDLNELKDDLDSFLDDRFMMMDHFSILADSLFCQDFSISVRTNSIFTNVGHAMYAGMSSLLRTGYHSVRGVILWDVDSGLNEISRETKQEWARIGTKAIKFSEGNDQYNNFLRWCCENLNCTNQMENSTRTMENLISESMKGLNILDLPPDQMFSRWDTLFEGKGLMNVALESRFEAACHLKLVTLSKKLKNVLNSFPVVGIFGTSNSGKTTLIHRLFQDEGNVDWILDPGYGVGERTRFPTLYCHDQMFIFDSMGITDKDLEDRPNLKEVMFTVQNHLKVKINLIGQSELQRITPEGSRLLNETIHNESRIPTLTGITHIDRLFKNKQSNDEESLRTRLNNEDKDRKGGARPCITLTGMEDLNPRWWVCLVPSHTFVAPTGEVFQVPEFPECLKDEIKTGLDIKEWILTRLTNSNQITEDYNESKDNTL